MTFIKAKHIYNWFLKTFGYVAIVNPFSMTCHVLNKSYPPNNRLVRHERKHGEQIKRHGVIRFCVIYLYYIVRYGYRNNPFEIEARLAESSI